MRTFLRLTCAVLVAGLGLAAAVVALATAAPLGSVTVPTTVAF